MNAQSTRRLALDDLRRMTFKARVARWWRTRHPRQCDCGVCQLRAAIASAREEVAELPAATGDAVETKH